MTSFPHPAAPTTPEETGLTADLLIGLALKFMKSNGVLSTSQLAEALCLSRPIIRSLTEDMVRLQLIEARGLALQSDLRSDLRFALTAATTS